MKINRILVPTDFSDTANKARDYALNLAELLGAEIVLLNAFHVPYAGASSGTLVNIDHIAQEESEKALKEQMTRIQENHPDISVKSVCESGLTVDLIKSFSKKGAVDLIVMGTTGASGLVGNLLGSNTAALIGSTKVPIIAVPHDTSISLPKNIVVANDLQKSGEEELFDILKQIVEEAEPKLDFLFIKKHDESDVSNKVHHLKAASFDEAFDTQYHPFHFRDNEDVEEGILDFVDKRSNTDLLVVVAHNRGFLETLFHKSISKSLTKHSNIPILVLPEQ